MVVGGISAAVIATGTFDITPPAGQAYCITTFGASAAFLTNVPDIMVSIADGALGLGTVIPDPALPNVLKHPRHYELYITDVHYLTVTNTAVGNSDIAWAGYRVNPDRVITALYTAPNAATVDVAAPAGQTWKVTEFGSEFFGAAQNHDVTVRLTDGTALASILIDQANDPRQGPKQNWYINDTIYLQILDTSGGDQEVAVVGVRVGQTLVGAVADHIATAAFDIHPPAGQEWVITAFSSEIWAGAGAPAQVPDVLIQYADGTDIATLAVDGGAGAGSLFFNLSPLEILIDNALYLTLTNNAAVNNEIGYSGYIRRQFT